MPCESLPFGQMKGLLLITMTLIILSDKCYIFIFLLGSVVPAGLIILMTFLDCSQAYGAVGVLIVGIGFFGLQYPGCLVNHVDIAPPFAGLLFGISNTFATVPGIVAPYVVGILAPQVGTNYKIHFYFMQA